MMNRFTRQLTAVILSLLLFTPHSPAESKTTKVKELIQTHYPNHTVQQATLSSTGRESRFLAETINSYWVQYIYHKSLRDKLKANKVDLKNSELKPTSFYEERYNEAVKEAEIIKEQLIKKSKSAKEIYFFTVIDDNQQIAAGYLFTKDLEFVELLPLTAEQISLFFNSAPRTKK